MTMQEAIKEAAARKDASYQAEYGAMDGGQHWFHLWWGNAPYVVAVRKFDNLDAAADYIVESDNVRLLNPEDFPAKEIDDAFYAELEREKTR